MVQGIILQLGAVLAQISSIFQNMKVHLTTTPEAFADGSPWAIVTDINTALKGIAYGLLILFFLVSFVRNTFDYKQMTLQHVIMLVVRFLLVKVVIDYSIQILNLIINISLGANDLIFAAGSGTLDALTLPQEVSDAIIDVVNQEWWERIPSFFQTMPLMMVAAIGNIIIWICGIVLVISVYMRFFRVYIYTAIAPLPLSTFGGRETSSTGKHFIKAYAAVCLEICIIALAMVIFSAITNAGGTMIWESWSEGNSVNAEYWDVVVNYIMQMVIQVGMLTMCVTGANRIIREIIGV